MPTVVDNTLSPGALLPDQGWYTHITLDSGNHVHISYQDNFTLDLRHANSVRNRVADFNADGKTDLGWYYNLNGTLVFWFMNGTAVSNVAIAGQVPNLNWRIEGLADFNNDNKVDVLWKDSVTGTVVIWLMNGSSILSVNVVATVASPYVIEGTGDLNGDGNADIVWKHALTGQVVVWLMNGAAISSANIIASQPTVWSIEKVGDFDGDGKADILWKHTSLGTVVVWRMNGASILSVSVIGTVSNLSYVIQDVGDVNADGTADIVWKNVVGGQVVVWTMARGTGTVSAAIITGVVPDLNWIIEGVGDLNADNKADIIWKYAPSGQVFLWLMNGPAAFSFTSPGAVTDLNWRIVN